MGSNYFVFIFTIILFGIVQGEDSVDTEVCSLDKESCVDLNSEEDLKKNYTKISWTDDYDYEIREELDAADDKIAQNQEEAVKMFLEILESHPSSARAKYSLARTYEIQRMNTSVAEERQELCDKLKDQVRKILDQDNLKEAMRMGSAQLLLKMSEDHECHSRPDMITALGVFHDKDPESRHSVVLCQELVLHEQYEEAINVIEQILEKKPQEIFLNILKSISLKMSGKEREANKFLRNIDVDETLEASDLKPHEVKYSAR